MLGLPHRTELNRRINKNTIYEKFQLDKKQKDAFDADISFIYIINEISEDSVGITKGEDTETIHILRVVMKTKEYNNNNIIRLFKLVGNKFILALEYENEVQTVAYFTKLFKTEWESVNNVVLELSGLNLDKVYENMIRQIAGDSIAFNTGNLTEDILRAEQENKMTKEITRLEKMARNEKQPKKKFELVQMIKKLKVGERN